MSNALTLHAVPRTPDELSRFGGGKTDRAKAYMLALYGFLAGKPDTTRRAYQKGIREFFELWEWKNPAEVGVADAAYYKRWLRARGLSDATVCLRLAACQSYFDFLLDPGANGGSSLVSSNPFRLVTRKDCTPTPYGRATPTEWSDFEKILRAIPDDATGRRDRAVLIFFANTGRRRSEVANLKVKDLNLTSNPKTYVTKVKGGKLQTFELSEASHQAILDHWISSNRLSSLTPESAVFGAIHRGPGSDFLDPHRCLSVAQVANILKVNAKRAGLDPRKFKLHGLRHMFAHDLNSAGTRLQEIQEALGHANIATTQIYTGKLSGPRAVGVQKQLDAIRQKAAREAAAAID